MAAAATSSPRPDRSGRELTDDLITLAGTPDDESKVASLLRSITQCAADFVPPVSYASVTVHDDDSFVTDQLLQARSSAALANRTHLENWLKPPAGGPAAGMATASTPPARQVACWSASHPVAIG